MKLKPAIYLVLFILLSNLSFGQINSKTNEQTITKSKPLPTIGGRISHFRAENGEIKFINSGASTSIFNFVLIPDSGLYKKVNGYIVYSRKNEKYYIRTRDEKIYPDKIKAIVWKNHLGKEMIAERSPNRDAWLFPILSGDIIAYSAFTENQAPSITHYQILGETTIYKIKASSPKEKKESIAQMIDFTKECEASQFELKSSGDVHKRCYKAIVLYNHRNEIRKK